MRSFSAKYFFGREFYFLGQWQFSMPNQFHFSGFVNLFSTYSKWLCTCSVCNVWNVPSASLIVSVVGGQGGAMGFFKFTHFEDSCYYTLLVMVCVLNSVNMSRKHQNYRKVCIINTVPSATLGLSRQQHYFAPSESISQPKTVSRQISMTILWKGPLRWTC